MFPQKISPKITFCANYIKSLDIQKINTKTGTKEQTPVSCVELNPDDDRDLKAVREVVYDWETPDGYDGAIYSYMRNYAASSLYEDKDDCKEKLLDRMRYFAITSQKDNFETLDSGDILALSQVKLNDDNVELRYLQVKPESFSSYLKGEKFKYIGTQMLNFVSTLFQNKDIVLVSLPHNYEFYSKNGYEMYRKGGHFIKRQSSASKAGGEQ